MDRHLENVGGIESGDIKGRKPLLILTRQIEIPFALFPVADRWTIQVEFQEFDLISFGNQLVGNANVDFRSYQTGLNPKGPLQLFKTGTSSTGGNAVRRMDKNPRGFRKCFGPNPDDDPVFESDLPPVLTDLSGSWGQKGRLSNGLGTSEE